MKTTQMTQEMAQIIPTYQTQFLPAQLNTQSHNTLLTLFTRTNVNNHVRIYPFHIMSVCCPNILGCVSFYFVGKIL